MSSVKAKSPAVAAPPLVASRTNLLLFGARLDPMPRVVANGGVLARHRWLRQLEQVHGLGRIRLSNLDETLERLQKHGAKIVGEVVQYENSYRLCYIRGPEGLLIGLAEEISNK